MTKNAVEAVLNGETDLGAGWTRDGQTVTWAGAESEDGFTELFRLSIWRRDGTPFLRVETATRWRDQSPIEALEEAEDVVHLPGHAVKALAEILWYVSRQMGGG